MNSLNKKITNEDFIKRAKSIHGEKYDYTLTNYINNKTKVKIICSVHGIFEQRSDQHLKTSGCEKCSRLDRRYTTNEFIEKAKKIHNNKYDYSLVEYKTNKITVKIICKNHGIFLMKPQSHLIGTNHKPYGCPKCGKESMAEKNKIPFEEFKKRAQKIHGTNRYNYNENTYKGTRKLVEIKCNLCLHVFKQNAGNHVDLKQGCPFCYLEGKVVDTLTFINKAKKIHNEKYEYTVSNYINCYTPVSIKCNKCHRTFYQKPNDHLDGHGCPKCFKLISNPEIEFLDYLKIPNTKENRQKKILNFKVDGIKDNIIYEFLGDFYHGNPKKYNPQDINQKNGKKFEELYNKTLLKFNKLNSVGYEVKYIWESDWNEYKKGKSSIPNIKEFI